jgi:branched-chain amino acid transport system permease protein
VDFTKLFGTLWDGFALGALYALLALGFVIIFKATQVVNFAHGAVASVGAYFVATLAVERDIPGRWTGGPDWLQWSLSVTLALGLAALFGLLLERVAIRPMIGEPLFSVAIITLGIDITLRSILDDFLGQGRPLNNPFGTDSFTVGGVNLPHTQIISTTVAFLAFLAIAAFFRTRTGIAMRATAFDQEAAMAQGVRVGRIFATAWAIGAVLATIAGIFAAIYPRGSGNLEAGTAFFALRAFPAVILGGLDSIKGAIFGGFIVGALEVLAAVYLGPYSDTLGLGFQSVVPYAVMLVGLLIRPYGLFGTPEVRRV